MEAPGPQGYPAAGGGDVLLALGVLLGLIVGSEFAVQDDLWTTLPRAVGPMLPSAGLLLLLVIGSLPLAARRIAPLLVFGVCAAASLAVPRLGQAPPLPLGVLVAVYTVAVRYRPLVAVGAAATYLGAAVAGIATGWATITDDIFYDYLVALVATVGLGYGVALSRAGASLADQRAREQEGRLQAAVVEERARIAREVHDIVAHDVSVIVAQAAAVRRTLPDGDAVEGTLRAIETVGRDALDGLRRLMHLLRAEAPGTLRGPQPGLDGLPLLLGHVRQAGLPVELEVHGTARRLPATVEINAYRIVQEALTNTLKHAGPAQATVVLDYRPDSLQVEVRDDGRNISAPGRPAFDAAPLPRPGGGFGLVGMRQRAALLEGSVDAGPDQDGGFRVVARLPVHGA